MRLANKITITCLFLLSAFILILYLNLGKIIEHFVPSSKISEFLKSKNGLELKAENLKIKTKLNFNLLINFDELSILTPEEKELVNLGKTHFEIKIFPLISKKIAVKKFDSDSFKINILREKNGKYEFEKYFNSKNKMDYTLDFQKGKFEVSQYEIDLQDDFENSTSKLFGQNLITQNTKDFFELKTNGEINTTSKNQKKPEISAFELDLKTKLPYKKHLAGKDFRFNISINNLDISQYTNYLEILNKDMKAVKGIFNIKISTNDNSINSEILVKNFEIPGRKFDSKASGEIRIDSNILLNPNYLEVEYFKLANKNIDVSANGKILEYKNKEPKLDLKFELKDTNAKSTIALLPNLIPTPEDSIFKLKKYQADGIAKGKLEVTGNLKKPQINGRIDVEDITLLNKMLKIPPSYGYVEFLGDLININVRALVGVQKYVDVTGEIGLYGNKEGAFHIASTKNLDLKTVQILVLPIRDIIGFQLGPVPIMDISGNGAIDLKTSGTKKNARLNGYFELNDVKASIEGFNTPLENGFGKIYFKDDKILFNNVTAKLNTANIEINGNADLSGNTAMEFSSKNLNNKDIYRVMKDNFDKNLVKKLEPIDKIRFQTTFNLGFKHKFASALEKVNLKDLNFEARAVGINSKDSDIVFNSGNLYLKNNKIFVDKFDFTAFGANIFADLTVDKVFDIAPKFEPVTNGKISLKSFPLNKLNDNSVGFDFANPNIDKAIGGFKDFNGELSGVFFISKNNVSGKLDLEGVSAYDKAKNALIKVNTGNIELKNNRLLLNALNLNYGTIPVYLNAAVSYTNPKNPFVDIHFSTSLSENDVDKIINTNLLFPVKVKGEIAAKGILKGFADNYNIYLKVGLDPQNDISYMGSNFGDVELKRELKASMSFKENIARINNLEYLKYVSSQNNKLSPITMLRSSGDIVLGNDNIATLRNFNIKTYSPTTVRIFNMIFKKSVLKQGQFNCDLILNGVYDDLKILGSVDFTDINIPLYNAKIKDAQLNFTNDLIRANLSGKGFESDVKIVSEAENKLKLPVVLKKLDINSTKINVGKMIDDLSALSTSQKPGVTISSKDQIVFNPKDLIIENGTINATEVDLYDIRAKNLTGKFNHLPNSAFSFYDAIFDIAGGKIVSDGTFDFETTKLILNSKIKNCEANILSQNFLGIANQLYGVTNGEIYLTGSKLNTPKGLKTVGAKAMFNIENGKMPRLGSLEYLLRAGNIYKSGILGLTLNNIIEVLIPYKTGEFSTIKGFLTVQSGIIEKLEISSKGENLSIFVHGKYDLTNDAADIEVLGRLSKKVSNLLGPIGNASFNSLISILSGQKNTTISENELVQNINKIPLIEISQNDYRIFLVKIIGDLNKEGYVKTFNWLN